jgi:hypothetical protein
MKKDCALVTAPRCAAAWPSTISRKVGNFEALDLFYLPMDDCFRMLARLAGRRVSFRADFGLYNHLAYLYENGFGS